MPRLPRSLLAGATSAVLLGAATACGDGDDPGADDSGPAAVTLSDLEFRGDEPLAWPSVSLCDSSLLVSANPLTGQFDAAVYDLASGDGYEAEVELPDGSSLEPGSNWFTSLECVATDDGAVVLAQLRPVTADDEAGAVYAGFDAAGEQLWVHDFTDDTRETTGHGVIAFKTGGIDDEGETSFVDPTSGDVLATYTGPSSESPEPISETRYISMDGLADLSGKVINPDVPHYDPQPFADGERVLSDALDLTAYDAATGQRLWTSDVPEPMSGGVDYDASLETLVWERDGTVYGVYAETGERLWAYQLDKDLTGDVYRAASGIAIVGTPRLEDYILLDTRTGKPVRRPEGLDVMSVDPGGITVVEDGRVRVVDRADLG